MAVVVNLVFPQAFGQFLFILVKYACLLVTLSLNIKMRRIEKEVGYFLALREVIPVIWKDTCQFTSILLNLHMCLFAWFFSLRCIAHNYSWTVCAHCRDLRMIEPSHCVEIPPPISWLAAATTTKRERERPPSLQLSLAVAATAAAEVAAGRRANVAYGERQPEKYGTRHKYWQCRDYIYTYTRLRIKDFW